MANLTPGRLKQRQRRVYSQNGEDGVLLYLLAAIGQNVVRFSVEVGATTRDDGKIECNTAILSDQGWDGIIFDEDEIGHPKAKKAFVTPDSFTSLLEDHNVPRDFGVLSIDVDGIDYWLWRALADSYDPSFVIIEYNCHLDPQKRLTVPNDPSFKWDGSTYYGASAGALADLAHSRGYKLVTEVSHLNLFFVKSQLVPADFREMDLADLAGILPPRKRHRPDELNRPFIEV